ncbi:MAG: dynamin family protein [Candidatus Magnetomorum sp.]|nr:dynamin family protein [Candidatus Magnetomorum sp.]
MENYQKLKTRLLDINKNLFSLVEQTKAVPSMSEQRFKQWETSLKGIDRQLAEELVRVAVIGAIKSGKSTFTNALFHGDYLKRGAGVVTSIVTRIRSGEELKATLMMKTIDEINQEVRQAVVLFPGVHWESDNDQFDIQTANDRKTLEKALEKLEMDQRIDRDARSQNTILLESYLKGYDRIADMLVSNKTTQIFDGPQFADHQKFVGDQSLAVYVKDIEIQLITEDKTSGNIEYADCQGSDSPNPMHIAMIQDYLLKAHLLLYVISSRTGIRQADIRFLSMIKKMGIMDQIFFVVNCDLSEHEHIEDLNKIIKNITQDIAVICPEPEVYAFSALMNLFVDTKKSLSSKDRQRLKQWQTDRDLFRQSQTETERFQKKLDHRLTHHRFTLLLKSNLERQAIIAHGIYDLTRIHQDILKKDRKEAERIIEKIQEQQRNMEQIRAMVKDTLDGAMEKNRQKQSNHVDSFFDTKYGPLMKDIQTHIQQYTIDPQKYQHQLDEGFFSKAIYSVFQDFKNTLDVFITEEINPKLHRFMVDEEQHIKAFLNTISRSYDVMVQDAIKDYGIAVKEFGIVINDEPLMQMEAVDMDSIKSKGALILPSLLTSMHYSARIRTEAMLNFGALGVMQWLKKIFKKSVENKEYERKALKKSIRPMKREILKSINDHFKDVRENLKYQYIFKLLKTATQELYEKMMDRFQVLTTDLSEMVSLVGKGKEERDEAVQLLKSLEISSSALIAKISDDRKFIE